MDKLFLKLFLILLLSSSANAKGTVAKIIKMRGSVTQLEPGSKVARKVRVGDKFKEDTSIVTGNKSFARIIFDDKSIMNLGPRTKVTILESQKDGTSFIHLLKGTLRSRVNKQKRKGSHKYYIKTRSAALGVRGTDFQVVYNPKNNISSLLTYKGEVAMAKVEEDPAAEVKRLKKLRKKELLESKVETTAAGEIEYIETKAKFNLKGRMEQALGSSESVVVKEGQYSGTVNSIKRASIPVKISPVQVDVLYRNTELKEKIVRSKVNSKKLAIVGKKTYLITAAEQSAPAEGFYKAETGEFAPRSGGILDLNSGLYIPPSAGAVYNKDLNIYIPNEKSGGIDSETGQYVAPKGLRLDAVKGFIALEKPGQKKNQVLLAMADELNLDTNVKLWSGSDKSNSGPKSFTNWSETEKISKDIIEVEVYGYGETLKSTGEINAGVATGASREFNSDRARRLLIKWGHNSESKWQPITSFSLKSTKYGTLDRGAVTQPTRGAVALGLGVRYNISSRWNLLTELLLEQEVFMHKENSAFMLKRVTVPKLKFGIEGQLIRSGKFSFDTNLYLIATLPKESGTHSLDAGLGYGVDLLPRWWLSKKWTVYTGFSFQRESLQVRSLGFKADNSHSKAGLKLGLGFLF